MAPCISPRGSQASGTGSQHQAVHVMLASNAPRRASCTQGMHSGQTRHHVVCSSGQSCQQPQCIASHSARIKCEQPGDTHATRALAGCGTCGLWGDLSCLGLMALWLWHCLARHLNVLHQAGLHTSNKPGKAMASARLGVACSCFVRHADHHSTGPQ